MLNIRSWINSVAADVHYVTITNACINVCSDLATQFSNCTDNAIRLMGGNSSNQGRLEVCVNSAWGSVCDSAGVFTSDEAKVVCRQLGILQVEGKDPIP